MESHAVHGVTYQRAMINGDEVAYTRGFCQSVGDYSLGCRRGTLIESDGTFGQVAWSDDPVPISVRMTNIIEVSKIPLEHV